MATEKATKPEYLYSGDLVDDMLKCFVEHLISMVKYNKRSSEDVSEKQVQEWVKKLLSFRERDDKYVEPVSLEWIMIKATTELQKEIEKYFSKK